jgi:hypothetical protein
MPRRKSPREVDANGMTGRRSIVPRSRIAIVVLAMSIGQVALANVALGADELPFRGSDHGGFGVPGPCPGGEEVVINGTGHATHLGAYSYKATECFASSGTFAGSATLTAANGDTFVGTYEGRVSGTNDPDVLAYQEELELSGGTGRFAGATGTLHVVGAANLATLEYEQILTGTVSWPDST